MKILVVEDERRVAQFIERGLRENTHTVVVANSCASARDALCDSTFDCIILDLGLPDGDGLQLLSEWRSGGFMEPVIILSARDAVQDRVTGLNLGADDYLPKPFSMDELLARVRSLLRRHSVQKQTIMQHGGLQLDLLARTVSLHGKLVEVTSREFALLDLFMQNTGRVLTRTQIAEKIWEESYDMDTNLIDVYIRRLRVKLEEPGGDKFFKTVRGTGYQFI